MVKHVTRTTGANPALPSGDCEVGSEWTILSTGITSVQMKTPSGAVWVRPTCTTADRPAAADVRAGFSIYDTTIGKPIFSTGTAWVDATGAQVRAR